MPDPYARATAPTLGAWLNDRPFTLCMSSGFFGFFAHCGMLQALESSGLAPRRVVGSSAGGMVGGCWASGLSAAQLSEQLTALRRDDFWDPAPGLGLLRGRRFARHLERILPTRSFEGCRADFAVSAYDMLARQTVVLDSGDLIDAIRATAALPGLFHPVLVGRRPMLDGGILDRPGHASLHEGERVLYHHLSSRSPWRRKASPALQVPRSTDPEPSMTTLVLYNVQRVSPFKLERGLVAMQQTREATLRALEMPVVEGVVAREV